MAGDGIMNILDRFTSIDDILASLLERIGGVTEEDTHFFSYPNDGTRATITKGTTSLDFMSGTAMTPAGVVSNLGNSLRARGREYCRSLSLQADRDIIIQIGTKSKIPVFAGTWFKVAHLRFTDLKIVAAETTRIFVIACTNPDSIEMAGETYNKDPVDIWGRITTIGLAEHAARTHCPISYDRGGNVIWCDGFEESMKWDDISYYSPAIQRSTDNPLRDVFCAKLSPNAAPAKMKKKISNPPDTTTVGTEFFFTTDATITANKMLTAVYDGTNCQQMGVRYYNDYLWYLNSAGGYTKVIASPIKIECGVYHHVKMVGDLASGEYVRIMFAGGEYPLTEGMYISADASSPYMDVQYIAEGTGGISYLDNVILTVNERRVP